MTGASASGSARLRHADWEELLRRLVDIDSGPGDEDGIGRVYEVLVEALEPLGFEAHLHATDGPDLLVADRAGAVPGSTHVALIGHADTVFPAGTVTTRPFRRAGARYRGPGVADMKGGLVVMLGALAVSPPEVLDRLTLTVLVNGDEESGSLHSRGLIESLAPRFDTSLVFEPGRPDHGFVVSRRGAHRFEVAVTGRPAHTGVNPEDGANAIESAAHHILAIQELGRSIPRATVNAVLISGGTRPNIVPEHATIRVDSRFDDHEAEQAVVEGVRRLEGDGPVPGTSTVVRSLDSRPAFPAREEAKGLAGIVTEAGEEVGVTMVGERTGGSSDGNFTSAAGVPTVDGLGAIGHDYHTANEYVLVDSIADRIAVCAGVLARIAGRGA